MEACTAWSFRGFSCCLKCSKLYNWYFQRWNCESSDRRTKESNLFCFIGPRYICLPSNYGKSFNYQVAPAKTGLISRGENHSLSWQFLHIRDRKRFRSRQRSLLLRVPSTNRDLCQQGKPNPTVQLYRHYLYVNILIKYWQYHYNTIWRYIESHIPRFDYREIYCRVEPNPTVQLDIIYM
jgi:hypothetical protein